MLKVILQAKETGRQADRRRNRPAAIVGNRSSRGGLPVLRAQVRRKLEPEPRGRVRPGNDGIGSIAQDGERNATNQLALTPRAQKHGRCHERRV